MVIREATLHDIPTIAALAKEAYIAAFGHTMSSNELNEALKTRSEEYFTNILNTDIILIAEEDQLLGFIQFGSVTIQSVKATTRDIELNKIYIDKNQQGKGIGSALMQTMLKHPRLKRVQNIYLDVYEENKHAIGLYEKYGFRIIGKTPFTLDGKIIGYDLLMKYTNSTF